MSYAPPRVEPGDVVLWYQDGDVSRPGYPAVVSGLGHDSIVVNIVDQTSYNFRVRDGVRHVGDPRSKNAELQESGCWDHTPQGKRLHKMAEQVDALMRRVSSENSKPLETTKGK